MAGSRNIRHRYCAITIDQSEFEMAGRTAPPCCLPEQLSGAQDATGASVARQKAIANLGEALRITAVGIRITLSAGVAKSFCPSA